MFNDRVDAKEVSDASQLPYSQQISQTIVVTEAGDYTATLQVHGISFDTMTNAEIDGLNRTWLSAIHTALASPNHALWTHIVRTRQKDVLTHNEYDNEFSADFVKAYNQSLEGKDFFTNRLYLSPVYRLAGTQADRFGLRFASKKSEDYRELHEQAKEAAQRSVAVLQAALKRYHTRQLQSYSRDGGLLMRAETGHGLRHRLDLRCRHRPRQHGVRALGQASRGHGCGASRRARCRGGRLAATTRKGEQACGEHCGQ